MPTRDNKNQEREGQVVGIGRAFGARLQPVRVNVSLNVVHADKRQPTTQSDALGSVHTHQ